MKIAISKSKNGNGYYTTLKNNYNGESHKMYMSVQLKKDIDLDYGIYDVDCFLSCYKSQNGEIKPKLVVTGIKGLEAKKTNTEIVQEVMNNNVYEQFGEEISIDDNFLLD